MPAAHGQKGAWGKAPKSRFGLQAQKMLLPARQKRGLGQSPKKQAWAASPKDVAACKAKKGFGAKPQKVPAAPGQKQAWAASPKRVWGKAPKSAGRTRPKAALGCKPKRGLGQSPKKCRPHSAKSSLGLQAKKEGLWVPRILMKNNLLTVSQLNFYVKSLLDENICLKNIFITGEISGFKNHYPSGHYYFSLKDSTSIIRVVMFKDDAKRLKFLPENGMQVLIRGRVSLYDITGQYQLYAYEMQPEGLGALNVAFEQLKEKLKNQGLFSQHNKKPLPLYPQTIAVVTSPTGAVLHDILNILNRRYPLAEILFCPVAVQGEKAANQIAKTIKKLQKNTIFYEKNQKNTQIYDEKKVDVIILARGGGSLEDLWPFNEEVVAHAVFESKIPIISAVGHETDFTICDFVADLRAPTPSAAAELVSPDKLELLFQIKSKIKILNEYILLLINNKKQQVDLFLSAKCMQSCELVLNEKKLRLEFLFKELKSVFLKKFTVFEQKIANISSKLELLSPLKILKMGYAILEKDSKTLKSITQINENDKIDVKLEDGKLSCLVLSKKEEKHEENNV
jgi:exodeoxyribonuclease VII large subunit